MAMMLQCGVVKQGFAGLVARANGARRCFPESKFLPLGAFGIPRVGYGVLR